MKHFSSRQRTILPLMIISLLISLACLTLTGNSSSATQAPEAISVEAEVEFGPGSFNLPDTKAGLIDLSSYKATLTLTFDGMQAGQPQQWSKTYLMLAAKEPAAHQLTIDKAGDISDLDPLFMAEMNGAAYEQRGENACTATVIEAGNSFTERLEPAGFLNGVIGAEEAGAETVNEVAADHYTFDERAFGQSGIAQSTGEMWVASDGGYIVKYLLTTKGNADYFGEGIEGTLTWDYELTNINQPLTFTLPDDCPPGLVNAPTLKDASNVLNMPGLLTYDTPTSLADATVFYQQEIPNLGWEPAGEPSISDTTAFLDFIQGDQTLGIIITTGDNGTTVNIVLGKAEK